MHWDYILILIVLAAYVPWRSAARIRQLLAGPSLSSRDRMVLYLSTIAFQWLIAAVISWRTRAHGLSLAALGLAVPDLRLALLISVALSALLVFNQVIGIRRLAALPREKRGMIPRMAEKLLPRSRAEGLLAICLVLTVACCEEFIYRGFVEGLFQHILGNSLLAGALISAALFSVAHLYQGRRGMTSTFIVGLIFSAARIWTGSLLPSVAAHFAVDFSAGIVSARLLPESSEGALAPVQSIQN